MSVEINDAEKNRGVEFTKGNGINEFNEPIDSKYKTQQKIGINNHKYKKGIITNNLLKCWLNHTW